MTTDHHQLCLDIIQKAKSFPRECIKNTTHAYTQIYKIEAPADNPNDILEAVSHRYTLAISEKIFVVYLYGCHVPLTQEKAQEIYCALESLYFALDVELYREREKQNREKLQDSIKKAQNLLNS
jgi:hypothetical protein